MPQQFSIEEKAYRKLLELQASDEFMADVLALHEKSKKTLDVIEDEEGNFYHYRYKDSPDFEKDLEKIRKKYGLSSVHQFRLKCFVLFGRLLDCQTLKDGGHLQAKLIPEIEGWPYTTLECDEEGHLEEITHYPENWDVDQVVAIELFPETTLNDIRDNWDRISKQRDRLYGIKGDGKERVMQSNNLERDLEIRKLRKEGKTANEILKIIKTDGRFKGAIPAYEEIPKIVKRLEERANRNIPRKET